MIRTSFLLAAVFCASAGWAQQPLSAIDWLEKQNSVPVAQPRLPTIDEPPVSDGATIPGVEVTPLGEARADSVGLLPTATTGLPRSLWELSETSDLTAQLARLDPAPLPAVQALLYTLLLAEADAPQGTGSDALFLKARVHALARFGAVDPARALLERAGPNNKALFDTWLSLSLLSGDEDQPCAILRAAPSLSADIGARVFCTARAGDWDTAALTYETGAAIGALSGVEADLLAQFLDPELVDVAPNLAPPKTPTPLVFRLYEAVGTPLPTSRLPRAFAMADLRGTAGWKAELEAAERLARTGALPATRLLGLYTERRPAASGGVWDRVKAFQAFDNALFHRAPEEVAATIGPAWQAATVQRLEVAYAELFTKALLDIELTEATLPLAFRFALLSSDYEQAAAHHDATDRRARLLAGIARGEPSATDVETSLEAAILKGFTAATAAPEHEGLLDSDKLGEAILAAALQLGNGGQGSEVDITAGLATLRAVGLEDTARRAALQLLILGQDR